MFREDIREHIPAVPVLRPPYKSAVSIPDSVAASVDLISAV
jgi:hypothetical protein